MADLCGPEHWPYQFQPFSGLDKIRVLKLHEITNHVIICSISEIAVQDGGYEALSYVWGSPERPYQAFVHDEMNNEYLGYISLTDNLDSALKDLWHSNGPANRCFWIDQICINQDGPEKSHQVEMMGQIFKGADRVVTYLGPSTNEEEALEGHDFLLLLEQHFEANIGAIAECKDVHMAQKAVSSFPVCQPPEAVLEGIISVHAWRWIIDSAFADWTTRLFCLQEQVLAKDIIALRGRRRLNWTIIIMIPVLFSVKLLPPERLMQFWPILQSKAQSSANRTRVSVATYTLAVLRWRRASFKLRLIDSMASFARLQCQDPRDRICALLGVSIDTQDLGIVPMYTTHPDSVARIFLDVSIRILRESYDLKPLFYAGLWNNCRIADLPSWALCPPKPIEQSTSVIYEDTCRAHPLKYLGYKPKIDINTLRLSLKGRILGTIAFATQPVYYGVNSFQEDRRNEANYARAMQTHTNWFKLLGHVGVSLETLRALSRVILADTNWVLSLPNKSGVIEDLAYHFVYLLLEIPRDTMHFAEEDKNMDVSIHMCQYNVIAQSLRDLFPSLVKAEEFGASSEVDTTLKIWGQGLHRGRSFCVMEDGKLANCMYEAHVGDVVAALPGADRLLLLRKIEGCNGYKLMGDAFVDSFMSGEAYEGVDPAEVDYDIDLY